MDPLPVPLAAAWLGFFAGLIGGAISGVTAALLAVYGNTRARNSAETAILRLERRSAFERSAAALNSFLAASLDLRYASSPGDGHGHVTTGLGTVEDSARAALLALERASAQTNDETTLGMTADVLTNYVTWRVSASDGDELAAWRTFWESCVSLRKRIQSELRAPPVELQQPQ